MKTATILDTIVAYKRRELAATRQAVPLAAVRAQASRREKPRDFGAALKRPGMSLIAECKKASPSKGLLAPDFDPAALAETYEQAGAAAVSVLTEAKHFLGRLAYLAAVRDAVGIPVLRKDFIFDPYQVYESAAAGADALLLIVAILTDAQLKELLGLAGELGLDCLVEVHDESEMRRAAKAGASIIGINNRDLATFKVDLNVTKTLAPLAPKGTTLVSESGIRTREDIKRLQGYGIDAVLVGETLVTSGDVSVTVRELFHDED